MTNQPDYVSEIKEKIQTALNPTHLEVIDESEQHVGHTAHTAGGRHFAISITSQNLADMPKVEAHQVIYSVLKDMIPSPIHALRIQIKAQG